MIAQPATVWPPLPYADWEPTKQTLHRYAQILGKVRMALVPFRTDGMTEREADRIDLPAVLAATRESHPREMVQELCRIVLEASGGKLLDDATVLCLDWHGGAA